MALKHLSLVFSGVPALSVGLGAGCFRWASSGFDVSGSAAASFATVNRKFQPKTKPSGLGAFPATKHFPFAINVSVLLVRLGVGCLRGASSGFDASGSSACSFATANRKFEQNSKASDFWGFPAFPSNTAVKAAPAFGLRWTLRDKASRSAPYLQRWA